MDSLPEANRPPSSFDNLSGPDRIIAAERMEELRKNKEKFLIQYNFRLTLRNLGFDFPPTTKEMFEDLMRSIVNDLSDDD